MAEAIVSKVCTRCKVEKPASAFFVNRANRDGLNAGCKECLAKYAQAVAAKRRAERLTKLPQPTVGQFCRICGRDLPLDAFYVRRDTGRLRKECKECFNAIAKTPDRKLKKAKWLYSDAGRESNRKKAIKYRRTTQGSEVYQRLRKRFKLEHDARNAVNYAVISGRMPRADSLKCKCGNAASQYHHHNGYEEKHWLDVAPVCHDCHVVEHYPESLIPVVKQSGC